jgi:hypothetical protein
MYDILDQSLFTIAQGIQVLSSKDDVIEAFGAPNSTNDYDDYSSLQYNFGDYSDAKFWCYTEDKKFNEITLRNFASDESDVTETSEEVPEYLTTYVAPTELGEDNTTSIMEFDGKIYALPAPLSEFLDDGWVITSKPDSVSAGNTDVVKVEKDGKALYLYIENFASYQTTPENCAVYNVTVYEDDEVSIILPGGITNGSTKEEVEAWITDEYSYYKGNYAYAYSYDDYDTEVYITVYVDVETEKVDGINVDCDHWPF